MFLAAGEIGRLNGGGKTCDIVIPEAGRPRESLCGCQKKEGFLASLGMDDFCGFFPPYNP